MKKLPNTRFILQAAQSSYRGGWFETVGAGYHPDIQGIDLASAYPYIMHHLPDLTDTKGAWFIGDKEEEWLDVGAWVYENFDMMSGVSFLPFSEHTYKQAPYQDIAKEEFDLLLDNMPKEIDWSKLSDYELTDMTIGSQELACVAGGCEI